MPVADVLYEIREKSFRVTLPSHQGGENISIPPYYAKFLSKVNFHTNPVVFAFTNADKVREHLKEYGAKIYFNGEVEYYVVFETPADLTAFVLKFR